MIVPSCEDASCSDDVCSDVVVVGSSVERDKGWACCSCGVGSLYERSRLCAHVLSSAKDAFASPPDCALPAKRSVKARKNNKIGSLSYLISIVLKSNKEMSSHEDNFINT